MLSVETYVKILLSKRGLKQVDLLRKMKELKLANDKTLVSQKLNNALNIKMGWTWARRIELALELPDYSLIKMIGVPTKRDWKAINEVKINNVEENKND